MDLVKYPRTRHLEGSRLGQGDHDLEAVPLSDLAECTLVVEEKIDGANAGVSFDDEGHLLLQSRGHFLGGGGRERHFALFKTWASRHAEALYAALGEHYVMYGEWLYAKHTIFYDALPHYFLEFDVLDRRTGEFLDTDRRRALLRDAPVVSVPVVGRGQWSRIEALTALIQPSLYKTESWRDALVQSARRAGIDPDLAALQTDASPLAEGLYIKHEQDGIVRGRYKYVRASFLGAVVESGSHWLDRPILPNMLASGVDLFAEQV